jgi:hypothetical protein
LLPGHKVPPTGRRGQRAVAAHRAGRSMVRPLDEASEALASRVPAFTVVLPV